MSSHDYLRYHNVQRVRELKRLIEKHPVTGRMSPEKQVALRIDLEDRKSTRGASMVVLQRSPLVMTPNFKKKTRMARVTWKDDKTTEGRKPLTEEGSPNKVRLTAYHDIPPPSTHSPPSISHRPCYTAGRRQALRLRDRRKRPSRSHFKED